MKRKYKVPANRDQRSLFPESLEDYVSAENPVRAIDAYVDSLDLALLNFEKAGGQLTAGQPCYDPGILLKLYIYGYINKARSSRCLERETHRNLEVLWLMGKLQPSYKTVSDFRKSNAKALRAVNKDFILMCKELELFGGEVIGIDGSFFNGNASKGSIHTQKKLDKQLRELDKKIADYQKQLDDQDRDDDESGKGSLIEEPDLADKLQKLKEKQADKQALAEQLKATGETQISTTDKDARLLRKRGQTTAGFNIQIAVDAKHKLIVGSSTCNDGNDSHQLAKMAMQAKATLDVEELIAVADAGYYESDQIKQCEDQQITAYVPVPTVPDRGCYSRDAFVFDSTQNAYICPQGEVLSEHGKPREKENKIQRFYSSKPAVCALCPQREKCLAENASKRSLYRWEHEATIERHKERMKGSREWMILRSALAEHPFGTLKRRAGWDHFLVRGLKKVSGEFGLMTLCYNFTRVINILGIESLREYCEQRKAVAVAV